MQAIANTINQAETAFVGPDPHGQRIRWFTPTVEVELCGHATLAAATFINQRNPFSSETFQSQSGPLTVTTGPEHLALDFPITPVIEPPIPINQVAKLFPTAIEIFATTSCWVVALREEAEVVAHQPDYPALRAIGQRGVAITASGTKADYCCRYFAPLAGVDEDHATGSAQTYLAPYWANKLGKAQLKGDQLSPRGATFDLTVTDQRVLIAGTSSLLVTGTIHLPA
jgi:PhzF family phenazine biosynthesis protein